MQTKKLTQELIEKTNLIIRKTEELKNVDLPSLQWRHNSHSWNVLECLQHLNLYGDFYLKQIERKIKDSNTKSETEFKSGLLGNYFAKSMLPSEKLKKMKTFKKMNPLNSKLDKEVINEFIGQQIKLLELLNQSQNVSLNKVKIATSISSLIKLKLGDTFRFYINHIMRHMSQIERIEKEMKIN